MVTYEMLFTINLVLSLAPSNFMLFYYRQLKFILYDRLNEILKEIMTLVLFDVQRQLNSKAVYFSDNMLGDD